MPKQQRYCKQCNKIFFVKPSVVKGGGGKYCSVQCKAIAITTKVEMICQRCGKKFKIKHCEYKRGDGKYCSQECYFNDRKKIKVNCKVCGKEMYVIPSWIKIGRGKYCSPKCYQIDRKIKLSKEIECDFCGKLFKRNVARINLAEKHFCSPNCQRKWFVGEKNPMWNGGIANDSIDRRILIEYKKWRLRVYKKFQYKCYICGSEKDIAAHHLYGFKDYPEFRYDVDNGVVLCSECHIGYHAYIRRNKFEIIPDSFSNYIGIKNYA